MVVIKVVVIYIGSINDYPFFVQEYGIVLNDFGG